MLRKNKGKFKRTIKRMTKRQYSKQWLDRWQFFVMFWLSIFFVADIWFNHCEHLEQLCITLVTSTVVVIVPYFVKSYLETNKEEELKFKKEQCEFYNNSEYFSDDDGGEL